MMLVIQVLQTILNSTESPVWHVSTQINPSFNYLPSILGVHWPQFLTNEHTAKGPDCPLNTRAMQVESIIATDMANHFEYISKVEEISEVLKSEEKRLKSKAYGDHLIIIIKCADISNLLISTKWGIVLSREFNEIAMLTDNMTKGTDIEDVADRRDGPFFPASVEEALRENPSLAKGQLFFINTFADSLFKEVATVFPELTFSAEIVLENKRFWMTI
ncbi:3',5'-cyclic-nucleotide phosphodiesterase regA [Cyberlindnera fabianii]|uniref:3',5'-cyclic-nucleotide phosphodiesterase regA n=1 Tax=Cyberlindnera fabianii TaxID=36022 RepID=A0A1V2L4H9_CYBFA|nr:3',5'-cyclic-nucleotide phosphodiesterase regA [Cyberlindnera fabianii]